MPGDWASLHVLLAESRKNIARGLNLSVRSLKSAELYMQGLRNEMMMPCAPLP